MVDAALQAAWQRRPDAAADAAAAAVDVLSATEPTLALYRAAAAAGAIGAPAQHPIWVESWLRATAADVVFAVFSRDGRPALLLALEVIGHGPFRVARFLGGSHANGNFPLCSRSSHPIDAGEIAALIGALAKIRPDIDLLSCERMLPQLGGAANPLLLLPATPSPNVALAADTGGGFEALLGRMSGKRKRKQHRSQARRLAEAGGHRRIEAATPAETARLLAAFFAMKAVRFRKMGVADVFAPAEVQAFFHDLFTGALAEMPRPFVLHGLEVGGKLRAVTGSSRRGDSLVCEFGSIAEDELALASPGNFLFFENIREAAQQGFALYDFSVGDEPYKRLWCEVEIGHFDVLVPLSAKGKVLAGALALTSRLKRLTKSTPALWAAARRLRRRAAGQPEGCGDD